VKKIIDSNKLQSEHLEKFLSRSPNHIAVLTDYAMMEAYKSDDLGVLYQSMEILSGHPTQVIILKGTQAVCGLSGRAAGLQRRLIDIGQTRDFS
jgi:hypothetical protein